jgi:hypothetical protein
MAQMPTLGPSSSLELPFPLALGLFFQVLFNFFLHFFTPPLDPQQNWRLRRPSADPHCVEHPLDGDGYFL